MVLTEGQAGESKELKLPQAFDGAGNQLSRNSVVGFTGESSIFPALSLNCLGISDLVHHFLTSHCQTARRAALRNENLEGKI